MLSWEKYVLVCLFTLASDHWCHWPTGLIQDTCREYVKSICEMVIVQKEVAPLQHVLTERKWCVAIDTRKVDRSQIQNVQNSVFCFTQSCVPITFLISLRRIPIFLDIISVVELLLTFFFPSPSTWNLFQVWILLLLIFWHLSKCLWPYSGLIRMWTLVKGATSPSL